MKSAGKAGEGKGSQAANKPNPTRAKGGAGAPPKTAQAPTVNPQDPKPGTSTAPANPKDPKDPQDENEPGLVAYIRSYQQAAKLWFDTVQESKEQAYITLYDTLLQISNPHINKLSDSYRKTVLYCIADKSGKYFSKNDFADYVAREDVEITREKVCS